MRRFVCVIGHLKPWSFTEPLKLSTGIRNVWVNGTPVWDEPRTTGARPGQVITLARAAAARR